jgi:hypothetical protein
MCVKNRKLVPYETSVFREVFGLIAQLIYGLEV